MIRRNIYPRILEALSDTPVVLINGARQTGKSTLAKHVAGGPHPARYLSLDDVTVLAAAQSDPDGFIRSLADPVVIDEVQRVPDLFRAIKVAVDDDRRSGRFLLTGSADIMLLPDASESLAGRMELITLWPFSQGEMEGREDRFVDAIFHDDLPNTVEATGDARDDMTLWDRVICGGYPEMLSRSAARRRRAWFSSYLTTLLQRDIRDLANIEGLTRLPNLLGLLATRTSTLVNYSEISRSSGLPNTTLKRYMALLEAAFLIQTLPPWHSNIGKRLVKSPKLLISDTGLAAHLLGLERVDTLSDRTMLGPLLENFVALELKKQITWSEFEPTLYHFRMHTGQEVDFVLERPDGTLVGIEVKASQHASGQDFNGLRTLRDARPKAFHRGLVLYAGEDVVGFEPHLHAVPLDALWAW